MSKNEKLKNKSMSYEKENGNVVPFEQNAEFYIRLAEEKRKNGNLLDALMYFRRAAEQENSSDVQFEIAITLSNMGLNLESNVVLIEAFPDAKTRPQGVYICMAENYLCLSEHIQSCLCYMRAAEAIDADDNSESTEAALQAADSVMGAFDIGSYLPEMEEVSNDAPGFIVNVGRRLVLQGHLVQALYVYAKFLGNRRVSHIMADFIFTLALLGGYKEIISLLSKVKIGNRENSAVLSSALSLLALSLGENKPTQTATPLKQAETGSPSDPFSTYAAAIELAVAGNYEKAMRYSGRLVRCVPYNRNLLHFHAVCCVGASEYKRAAAQYEKIMKIHPDDITAREWYALCKQQDKDPDECAVSKKLPFVVNSGAHIGFIRHDGVRVRLDNYLPEHREAMHIIDELVEDLTSEEKIKFLRRYLVSPFIPENMMSAAMRKLKAMRAKPPFSVAVGQIIIEGDPYNFSELEDLPEAVIDMARMCVRFTKKRYRTVCAMAAVELWYYYGNLMLEAEIDLDAVDADALAAAVTFKAAARCNLDASVDGICRLYEITNKQLFEGVTVLDELYYAPGI